MMQLVPNIRGNGLNRRLLGTVGIRFRIVLSRVSRFHEIRVVRVQSWPGAGSGETVEHHVLGRVGWPIPVPPRIRVIRVGVRAMNVPQGMDGGYGFRGGRVDRDVQQSHVRDVRLFVLRVLIEGRIHPYVRPVNGIVHEHRGIDGVVLHDYGEIVGRVKGPLHHDPVLLMDARSRWVQIVVGRGPRRGRRGNVLRGRGGGDPPLYSVQYTPPSKRIGALRPLHPRLQVQSGVVAGKGLILQSVPRQEDERLNGFDVVHRDAQDLGQGDASDLLKLSSRETVLLSRILVPEPVPPAKVVELLADYTGERWPHQTALHRLLSYPACEQIDVLHRRVHRPELARRRRWDRFLQVVEVSYGGQGAGLPPIHVRGDTVISAPLYVDGSEVHAEGEGRGLEQVIGQLFAYVLVPSLGGLIDQAEEKAIHGSSCLQIAEIGQLVVNRDVCK